MKTLELVREPSRGVQRGGAPLPGGLGGVPPHPTSTSLGGWVGTVDVENRHTNGRKVRIDALPEHVAYRDGGCDLAPTCLRCPLARCRYDEPGGARKLFRGARDGAVLVRRGEGLAINGLASEFGISRRSVFRILARGRG